MSSSLLNKMRTRPPHSRPQPFNDVTVDAQPAAECPYSRRGAARARIRTLLAALIAAAALAGTGCGEKKFSDRDLVLVDTETALEAVGTRKKLLGIAGEKTGAWVDPRSERAFREGHIPGAISLPFQYVTVRRSTLEGYDVLIVYGDGYKDPVASGMSKRLMELGFKDVRTLRGGLVAWENAGFELETGDE
jgi:3-mercaptopyruvate sulfurtransferase SseA